MTETQPTAQDRFQSALIDRIRMDPSEDVTDAIAAILPDYLVWDESGWHGATRAARCGGGDPPEAAGFDSFELDEIATPAWAVEAFYGLAEDQQESITENALTKALKERE